MMKYSNESKMKGKSGKNQPLPKGDKYHYYPKGASVSGDSYPDSPADVLKAQNKNVKVANAAQYGMRH